jgi:hypothetical protein
MSRIKAVLIFDPDRRQEQMAFAADRAQILHEIGDQLWVSITEEQVPRFAERGITVQLRPESDWIELPAIVFDPAQGEPEPPTTFQATEPTGDVQAYYLVQFIVPVESGWIGTLIQLGGNYVQNLPVNASVFRLTAAQAAAARQLEFVGWVGLYHPAYALGHTLAGRSQPFDASSLRELVIQPASLPTSDAGNIQVRLFDDVNPNDVRTAFEATGATIVGDTGYGFVLNVNASILENVLKLPGVLDVDVFFPPQLEVDRGRIIVGAGQVGDTRAVDFLVRLNGTGEIAGIIDGGLDNGTLPIQHPDLGARVLQISHLTVPGNPVPDTDPHGTHVAGIIGGDGTQSNHQVRGVAPAAHIVFQGPTQLGTGAIGPFLIAHHAGARVHNNSWGTPAGVTNNVYANAITGEIDRFCCVCPDSLIVFSSGNDERDTQVNAVGGAATPDGILDMNRLRVEKLAKNALIVGASENVRDNDGYADTYRTAWPGFWNHANFNASAGGSDGHYAMSDKASDIALFSIRGVVNAPGPVATGRVRPDVVAPGTNILSLRSTQVSPTHDWQDPGTVDKAFYMLMHGTSMAAPHVTGAALLVRQYYRARFGQLRRPQLLEGVALPASGPQPNVVDRPAVAPRANGLVFAWVTPAAATAQKHIVAARFARDVTWVDTSFRELQTDVGDHPAPLLARHDDHILLVYRRADNNLRLCSYRQDLTSEPNFGANGVVTLAPGSRQDDARPPALLVVNHEAAVAWADGNTDSILFQRFNATTGAPLGNAAVSLGPMTQTSPQPFIAYNGNQYAVAWVNQAGTNYRLQLRCVDNTGALVGSDPLILREQTQIIRDAQLIWDAAHNRFVLVWCDSRSNSGGEIYLRFLDQTGAAAGAEVVAMPIPANQASRRPLIAVHPLNGYVLAWEDNSQNNEYDVYVTFLDDNGQPDGRIPIDAQDPGHRRLLRISDTPQSTGGLVALIDGGGVAVAWQGLDEINSDQLGVYALNITPQGAFQAQVMPNTPLLDSGRYVAHQLLEHNLTAIKGVSIAWAGGDYYLLHGAPHDLDIDLQLIRTNADGLVDTTFGVNGARTLPTGLVFNQHEIHWTGQELVCASVGALENPRIYVFDQHGAPLAGFGVNGVRTLNESSATNITAQLGHIDGPPKRLVMVYGAGFPLSNTIRYVSMNLVGGDVTAPRDLVPPPTATALLGTARRGWFHFINEVPPVAPLTVHAIAIWHVRDAGTTHVFLDLFRPDGTDFHTPPVPHAAGAHIPLTGLAGESKNAVIAPRPVGITAAASQQREYSVAWQYHPPLVAPDPQPPWEIRFSRLNPDGTIMANPLPPAPARQDVRVIFSGAPGWVAGVDAIEPQLVCTFTHEPWQDPPAGAALAAIWNLWSPGYGLAWLGQPAAGGNRTLYFTILDENGVRPQLPLPPPYAPLAPHTTIAPIIQVSKTGADVQEFKLIWNGRSFRLTWTEVESGKIRHMQTALTRQGSQAVFDQPSSALLRATLINGATNLNQTSLPNLANGYGWGRINLRQSLAPSPPVTYYVRDDNAIGPARTVHYRFNLPPNTEWLRATLTWNDPLGARVVNQLNLRITARATGQIYHGNDWQPAPNRHLSRVIPSPPAPAAAFDAIHTIQQIVIHWPPAGDYDVDVIAQHFAADPVYQFRAQPFVLVFVGSGAEVAFGRLPCDTPYH